MIQESKFLGGDMEHTHLVKGLDYALLQKVRSEITVKEQEEDIEKEEELEKEVEQIEEPMKKTEVEFQTIMGKNIFNRIASLRSRHVEKNELFAPGRMAYVIDFVDDENVESDIPTTLVRSKADVPVSTEDIQTLTTNDIVINKLAQILSYLRQGGRGKKNKKRDKDKPLFKLDEKQRSSLGNSKEEDDSIYGEIGDYKPSRRNEHHHNSSSSNREQSSSKSSEFKPNYFNKSDEIEDREPEGLMPPPPKISAFIARLQEEPEGYAECYPGLEEMNDAIDDSDDEVDYTKMDLGNKKGPIGKLNLTQFVFN